MLELDSWVQSFSLKHFGSLLVDSVLKNPSQWRSWWLGRQPKVCTGFHLECQVWHFVRAEKNAGENLCRGGQGWEGKRRRQEDRQSAAGQGAMQSDGQSLPLAYPLEECFSDTFLLNLNQHLFSFSSLKKKWKKLMSSIVWNRFLCFLYQLF